MGRMIMGIRKEWIWKKEEKESREEGIIVENLKYGKDRVKMVVYVNVDIERKLEGLREWMEGKEKGVRKIFGEDFNARTGEEGDRI